MNKTMSSIAVSMAMILSGCGGSSGGSDDDATGSFSLSVTDGPIDSANQVVVVFTGVSIKPADGTAMEFTFDTPMSIDLLQLQGSIAEDLLSNETIPVGDYDWVRLHVTAEHDDIMDSFIELSDGTQKEIWVPSGSKTGLKLVQGFTVAAGGNVDFTIDFDLRKSLTDPQGLSGVILKPTLRLVDNISVGSVAGSIDASLVSELCADASIDDGTVYIYSGADITPSDLSGADSDPVTTALVNSEDSSYQYEIGFLVEGDYTIAYTCDAVSDDPLVVDELTFSGTTNVSVTAGTTSTIDFQL